MSFSVSLQPVDQAATAKHSTAARRRAEERRALARSIFEQSRQMSELVANVLEMTRLEGGAVVHREWVPLEEIVGSALVRLEKALAGHPIRTDLDPALPLFALDPLLGEAMRVVSARAQDKQLRLVARISPGLGLRADRRALKQVALNLLSNAVKFTPEGGSVTVRGRATDHCIVLGIADTGIGIAKDALAKLGRPFEQVESQLTKSHQGSGLGLAIAKSLVELHGGSMRIRSTLGRGTLVVVRLPLEPRCPLPKAEAA